MDYIKYIILLPPVNRYLISLISSSLYSVVGSAVKKTLIYTAKTAYTTIVSK